MANWEDLKLKARDAIEAITDVSVEAYKLAEERTKALRRSAKLNADISREKTQIRRMYSEIGRMYYEQRKNNPEENFAQTVTEVTAAYEHIAAMKKEIEELKKTSGFRHDDFFDADFTSEPDENESGGEE